MDASCMGDLVMALLSIGQFHEKSGLLVTVRLGSLPAVEYASRRAAGFDCDFNRSMQHIEQSVLLAF